MGDRINLDICQQCHYIRPGYVEYKNFELGVLFQSSKKLQYRALNPTCSRHRSGEFNKKEGNVCVLPLPYDMLGGEKYYDEEVEAFKTDTSEPWVMIRDAGKEETRKRLLNVYSTHFLRSLGSVHSSVDDDTLRDRKFNDISVDNGSIENIEGKQEQLEPPNKKVAISSTDRVSNPTKLKEKEGLISLCLVSPYSTPSLTPSSTPQKANVDQETDTSKFGAFSPNSAGVTAFL